MIESWNYQDVVRSAEALKSHRGEEYTNALVSEWVLDATADRIAARALRRAAHALNGSDPSIDPVVEWLLNRASEYLEDKNA